MRLSYKSCTIVFSLSDVWSRLRVRDFSTHNTRYGEAEDTLVGPEQLSEGSCTYKRSTTPSSLSRSSLYLCTHAEEGPQTCRTQRRPYTRTRNKDENEKCHLTCPNLLLVFVSLLLTEQGTVGVLFTLSVYEARDSGHTTNTSNMSYYFTEGRKEQQNVR